VINTLRAKTTSDGLDGNAPERVHLAEIHQLPAAVRRAHTAPQYVVPQGKVGLGHRGPFCGWTIGPAPGHSAAARKG
jgi:hypothetical protein